MADHVPEMTLSELLSVAVGVTFKGLGKDEDPYITAKFADGRVVDYVYRGGAPLDLR